jgi:hypothetical protein
LAVRYDSSSVSHLLHTTRSLLGRLATVRAVRVYTSGSVGGFGLRPTPVRTVAGRFSRRVVWRPKIKATGTHRNYWWHLAAGLSFLRTDAKQWCFCIRPERRLTSDGTTPLPPKQVGKRVTSKKARMWDDGHRTAGTGHVRATRRAW